MEQEGSSQQTVSPLTPVQTLTIERLQHVWQVVGLWESIAMAAGADGKGFDAAALLQQVIHCLKYGGVFIGMIDGRFVGFTVIEKVDTVGVLHIIQADLGLGLGRYTLISLMDWAKRVGIKEFRITINTFNGSGYKYIKKYLGFKRQSETFALTL